MPPSVTDRLRASPLIAASGAVALLVLVAAVGGLVTFVGPGAFPDPGGRRLGTAILAAMVGVAVLWLLVVARAVRGVVDYADAGERPTGLGFALAVVEGSVATGMLVIASAAGSLSNTAGETEVLAIGAYLVAVVGVGLALASLTRAGVAFLGPA
ncbi:hypothetical protein [Halobaculum marinum]|uniref:Uncharacterized protein n=1 Tax=Halobaculum marinum TaxID=3031996 RepID=A0ABD5WZ44_9EURY|nr:hypothetical protein [Halobaculum sp. DT55]